MDDRAKGAQEWFRRGTEAMNHQNWAYAVECFGNALKLAPDNLIYRQSRHGCLRKKYDDNGTGARMSGVRLIGVRTSAKKARMQKNWAALEAAAEDGLSVNPWDASLFFDLGEALLESENFGVAKYALGKAVELDASNLDYLRRYGHFLREREDFPPAISCFERILKLNPTDAEARSLLNKLRAESAMVRGGYGQAETTKDVKAETQAPVNAYEEDRRARKGQTQPAADAPGESVEADLTHAIRKDPKNINNYLKLADHFRSTRELPKAKQILIQAVEVSGNNLDIAEQLEDVELLLLRNDLVEADERAKKNPTKERIVEKAKVLRDELLTKEVDIFARRIERHPNDMRMRYDLAERYRTHKQWSKAIPLLQQATTDGRLKADALVALGDCFVRDGKLDLGRRQFERALESLNVQDKPDAFKTAHYWLGRIYEKAKKVEQAEHHFHEILAVDYEYKDVLKRLEGLQGADSEAAMDEDE